MICIVRKFYEYYVFFNEFDVVVKVMIIEYKELFNERMKWGFNL